MPRHRLKKLRTDGEPRPATAMTKTIGVAWDALDEFLPNGFDVGGPRAGAVHGWALADGGTAYMFVERMSWLDTLPSCSAAVGELGRRGADLDPQTVEAAEVLCSIIVMGFPPAGGLRETGYRAPKNVDPVLGAVHTWESLPRLLEKTDRLVAAGKAMKALFVSVARVTRK